MAIRIQCPECEAVYQLKDELAGKSVRCKSCGATIPVRASRPPEEQYEVVHDDDEEFEEPVARPGRGGSRSRSGIKVSNKKNRSRDDNSTSVWKWVLGGCGVMAALMVLVCGGLMMLGSVQKPRNLL